MADIQVSKRHHFEGHKSGIFDLKNSDGNSFLSAGGDGQVVKWDAENGGDGQVIAKVDSTIYAILQDNDRLLVGENSRGLHLVDIASKQPIRSVAIKSPIFSIEKLNDQYLVGTGAGELFVFDNDLDLVQRLKPSKKSVRSIAVGEADVALGLSDNSIRILDKLTFTEKYNIQGHTLSVFSAKFHPLTQQLVSTGRDAQIKIWDTFDHFEELKSIPAHMYASNHLVFHPSGKYFASGSMDKTIKIWDGSTFELLKVIDLQRHGGHKNSVNKLLWMTFENLLVTCSDDRTIAVWDIKFD